jgi:DNA-binding response OmpR family regulator
MLVMNDQTGKLFVVESDDALRATLVAMLRDSGYEVSTDYRGGMNSVLAFGPDLVILGADPPQLDCCDLLSEIKGSKHTRNIRVVMLVHGSSAERARGLDLGADDALSLPVDPAEFLSRMRSQLRSKDARHHLIKPVVTQGHIGAVLPDRIVYDAQTTSGGSGGPLFNNQGEVIGINFAMVRDFGGSNFAIPVRFGQSLLKP